MAKTGSYIKIDRGLKNNSLWLEKPFSKGQAWVDLLILAQWADREKLYRGKVQTLIHGKVYTSLYFLSERWGWSRNKVYRFLGELMHDEMIEIQGWTIDGTNNDTINRDKNDTKNGTIITIVNWEFYQYSETNDDTNNGTKKRTNDFKKTEPTIECNRNKRRNKRNNKGRSAPDSPSGMPERGTDAFRNKSHLLLKEDEGTLDDIPIKYRDGTYNSFDNFADYWRFRNQ